MNADPEQHEPEPIPGLSFHWHARRRDWTNFSFRRHRRFDAYLVTMHQSGTHWLKYLLTLMITREHGLEVPDTISDNVVIGGPKEDARYALTPRLGHSHTIPSPLLGAAMAIPALGLPRYAVLVRDIRDVLSAHYRKWQDRYDCSFATYLRGDVRHRRFEKDIWWDFRYLNTWAAILKRHPARTMSLRYEDLQGDPHAALRRLVAFLEVPLADVDAAIDYALANATKGIMSEKDIHPYGMPVVHDEVRDWDDWYAPADRDWFRAACARHLHNDFGYGYADWH